MSTPDDPILTLARETHERLNIDTRCLNPACPSCVREQQIIADALRRVQQETREQDAWIAQGITCPNADHETVWTCGELIAEEIRHQSAPKE